MSEHETSPQRPETPGQEPSHRPADASFESGGPERGQSEPTAAHPTVPQPVDATPAAGMQSAGGPGPTGPVPGAASPWQAPAGHPQQMPGQPGQPLAGHPGQPLAGQPFGGQPMPGQPMSGQPMSGQPMSGQPMSGQPPYSAPPGVPPQQPYATQQFPQYGQPYPGAHTPGGDQQTWAGAPDQAAWAAGQRDQAQWAGAQPGPDQAQWAGGQPQPEQPPIWSAGQPAGHDQQPPWAAPVATQNRPAGPGRGRKTIVAGAAAILIALAGGGVGAATVLAMDNDNNSSSSTVPTANSSVSRVVDRSSLAQIAAAVQDSVVSITTNSGEGSGVVLTADGYVLTNNHVVATAQGDTVSVIFANGKKTTAKIVGTDPRTDLAVIKADGVSGLKAATPGDSGKMQVGDTVLALGSPLGLVGSVTSGIISAKDRTIQSGGEDQQPQNPFDPQQPQQQATTTMSGLLQTDAPINPGNSGGALVNTNAEVIGINSAIATSGQGSGNIGLGFAIPSNKAWQVAKDLMAGRKVSHPALGVNVTEAEGGGALVSNVVANGAAAKAGIEQGDVITTVNGKPINDSDDLVAVIQAGKVGDQVTVVFTRNGAQKTVTATLTDAG